VGLCNSTTEVLAKEPGARYADALETARAITTARQDWLTRTAEA